MKIEQKEIAKKSVDVVTVAEYSQEEIVNLIVADLEQKGHKAKEMVFKVNATVHYDEWGFNPVKNYQVDGATVTLFENGFQGGAQ